MAQSLKKNIAYKGLLTFANYIIGFLTFPYITRVLGPEKYGLVNFVLNTIDYFLIFATLGIGVLGVREIAKVKENRERRSKVFCNLLGLNVLFTILVIIVYVILVSFIPQFHEHASLFYIGIAKIIFTAFLLEWFFTGLEDFKFITIRSLVIRTFYLLCVFIFIKDEYDYQLYFYLTVMTIVLNSFVNTIYASKLIDIKWNYFLDFKFLKKDILLGIYSLMTSAYLTFNVMYLGLVTNDAEVGCYTASFRLYAIILSLFSAYSTVMTPRMSSVIQKNDKIAFSKYIKFSISLISTIAIPLIICSIILAPQIIQVLSGSGYEGAITPMRILMPAILAVCVAQIIVNQILIPARYDGVILHASIIGAIVAIIINVLFVKHLGAIGSAIVLLTSEITVTTFYLVKLPTEYIKVFPKLRIVLPKIISGLPSIILAIGCCYFISNPFISVCVCITGAAIYSVFIVRKFTWS